MNLWFYYLGIQDWLLQNGIGNKNDFRIGFNIQIHQQRVGLTGIRMV